MFTDTTDTTDANRNPSSSRPYRRLTLVVTVIVGISGGRAAMADSDRLIRSPEDALRDGSSLIEARVADIGFGYDPILGPRTITTLTNVMTHAGEVLSGNLQISTLGGPLPDGRTLDVPELPEFRLNSRYLVLLTGSNWFFSPVVSDYAFRIERIGGRDVLVGQTGHAVVRLDARSLESTDRPVAATEVDARRPFAPPALVTDANVRAEAALSLPQFVEAVRQLSRGAPLRGGFKRNATTRRAWNVTAADGAPTSATGGNDK
jgi:hypothetical protein